MKIFVLLAALLGFINIRASIIDSNSEISDIENDDFENEDEVGSSAYSGLKSYRQNYTLSDSEDEASAIPQDEPILIGKMNFYIDRAFTEIPVVKVSKIIDTSCLDSDVQSEVVPDPLHMNEDGNITMVSCSDLSGIDNPHEYLTDSDYDSDKEDFGGKFI